jgi:hypothetical protein
MFAGRQGWLGPEIQGQANQIDRTLGAGVAALSTYPEQAGAAISAASRQYPYQAITRLVTGTGIGYASRTGGYGSVSLGTAAAMGSMAHVAFKLNDKATPELLAVAGIVGEVCTR